MIGYTKINLQDMLDETDAAEIIHRQVFDSDAEIFGTVRMYVGRAIF